MLEKILEKCKQEKALTDEEIVELLSQTEDVEKEKIFKAARHMREKYFGNKVFLYGFVYFSTYCKNNCTFCYFRTSNGNPPRYRKQKEEVINTAVELQKSGVHAIDLTTGDDLYYTAHPERLAEIVKEVRKKTGLPVMVSPGLLDEKGLSMIKESGAAWYALYQETHNKALFEKLRIDQSYEDRMNAKMEARKKGLLIEEGLLTGVGDTKEDRAHSFRMMGELGASQIRVMTFIEQTGIPLKSVCPENYEDEVLTIAVMRLLYPKILIPASLDVEGLKGLKKRLMAGANVVTSIIPPKEGYAGVAKSEQDIDEGYRTVKGIAGTLEECRLMAASAKEYSDWVNEEMKLL